MPPFYSLAGVGGCSVGPDLGTSGNFSISPSASATVSPCISTYSSESSSEVSLISTSSSSFGSAPSSVFLDFLSFLSLWYFMASL